MTTNVIKSQDGSLPSQIKSSLRAWMFPIFRIKAVGFYPLSSLTIAEMVALASP